MVIIRPILVVLVFPMLHYEFQGHRSTDSEEEDIFFLTIYEETAILVM